MRTQGKVDGLGFQKKINKKWDDSWQDNLIRATKLWNASEGMSTAKATKYLVLGEALVTELVNHCEECMAKLKGHPDQEWNCTHCPTTSLLKELEETE
jgi:hypothetical protein